MQKKHFPRTKSFAIYSLIASAFAVAPMTGLACGTEDYLGSICVTAANYCPEGFLPADGQMLQIRDYPVLYSIIGSTYGGDDREKFVLPDLRGRVIVGAGVISNGGVGMVIKQGDKAGSESVVLQADQVPVAAHTHSGNLQGAIAEGPVSLNVNGSSIDSVTGQINVNGMSSATGAGKPVPDPKNNTIGKATYYQSGSAAPVSFPVDMKPLTITGVVTGSASGNVKVPVNGSIETAANSAKVASKSVSLINPRLGLTYCIAVNRGIYPSRP